MYLKQVGLVNHSALSRWLARSSWLLYPTQFPETSCISLMKAQAMGAIPLTSRYPRSALKETCGTFDLGPVWPSEHWPPAASSSSSSASWVTRWADAVVDAVQLEAAGGTLPTGHTVEEHRAAMQERARESFRWSRTASLWLKVFRADSKGISDRKQQSTEGTPSSLSATMLCEDGG